VSFCDIAGAVASGVAADIPLAITWGIQNAILSLSLPDHQVRPTPDRPDKTHSK